jgi:hypothetical protein
LAVFALSSWSRRPALLLDVDIIEIGHIMDDITNKLIIIVFINFFYSYSDPSNI